MDDVVPPEKLRFACPEASTDRAQTRGELMKRQEFILAAFLRLSDREGSAAPAR
jgi:hypothetical protein